MKTTATATATVALIAALTGCSTGETPETIATGLGCELQETYADDQMPTEYECGNYTIVDYSTAGDTPQGAADYAEFLTVATDLRTVWVTDELFIIGDKADMATVTIDN